MFPVRIPPFRERKADIPALTQHFVSLKTRELRIPAIPALSSGAVDYLKEYHRPGKVRELESVIGRALI